MDINDFILTPIDMLKYPFICTQAAEYEDLMVHP